MFGILSEIWLSPYQERLRASSFSYYYRSLTAALRKDRKGQGFEGSDSSLFSFSVLEFAEFGYQSSPPDFCLACTKPALFPWQPYQWQFGGRPPCADQMTNQQHWFHHTSTERPFYSCHCVSMFPVCLPAEIMHRWIKRELGS